MLTIVGVETVVADVVPLTIEGVGTRVIVVVVVNVDVVVVAIFVVADDLPTIPAVSVRVMYNTIR